MKRWLLAGLLIVTVAQAEEPSQLARIAAYYKNLSRYSVSMRIEVYAKSEPQAQHVFEASSFRHGAITLQKFGNLTVFSSPQITLMLDQSARTIHVNDRAQDKEARRMLDWDPQAVLRRSEKQGYTISESLLSESVLMRITGPKANDASVDLTFDRDTPWLRRMEMVTPARGDSVPTRVVVQYEWQKLPERIPEWFKASHYVQLHAGSLVAAPDFPGYRVIRERAPQD
jgi:hypothetical protein